MKERRALARLRLTVTETSGEGEDRYCIEVETRSLSVYRDVRLSEPGLYAAAAAYCQAQQEEEDGER